MGKNINENSVMSNSIMPAADYYLGITGAEVCIGERGKMKAKR